jgi:hypothetical protein
MAIQSKIGFIPLLGGGAPTSIFNLASNGEKLLLGYAMNFNPWKWLEDGLAIVDFAVECADFLNKKEEKNKQKTKPFLYCLLRQ